ncbi:MAG TPA: hypothetical protein VG276_26620 [Actinomycetes bacterium]|jgi:hypothetical protein|nr:hypothetical protein [Actinomycetes bacterium]
MTNGERAGVMEATTVSPNRRVSRIVMAFARRHPLACYFALAHTISWACWIPLVLAHRTVRAGSASPTHFPGLVGPAIAAFVMTAAVQGRTGIRDLAARIGRWRVAPRWYLVAVATPVVGPAGSRVAQAGQLLIGFGLGSFVVLAAVALAWRVAGEAGPEEGAG